LVKCQIGQSRSSSSNSAGRSRRRHRSFWRAHLSSSTVAASVMANRRGMIYSGDFGGSSNSSNVTSVYFPTQSNTSVPRIRLPVCPAGDYFLEGSLWSPSPPPPSSSSSSSSADGIVLDADAAAAAVAAVMVSPPSGVVLLRAWLAPEERRLVGGRWNVFEEDLVAEELRRPAGWRRAGW